MLVKPHSLKRQVVEDSNVTKDITCYLGTPQCQSELRHRMVMFQVNNQNVNTVFNQLFAALMTYVLLKLVYDNRKFWVILYFVTPNKLCILTL
ncbi:hypothetical protein [Paenibacillus sp. CMAA1364]